MNKILRYTLALAAAVATVASANATNPRLVILHTNDTHSQIDPSASNTGGVARRKVLVDSVRRAESNVMLVDAGDAVQGTLYFSLFGGELENKLMNAMGYDIRMLGNHEFDNGMDSLAHFCREIDSQLLSSNYYLEHSSLQGLFKPYTIKKEGKRKIGFIAINLEPTGMIADKNSEGVMYRDAVEAANSLAWVLKNMEGCDMVVAITHIGYESNQGISDLGLAAASSNIDVIIGGHSHTTVDPLKADAKDYLVRNAVGDTVLVAQTGKGGAYLGEVDIDLKTLRPSSKLIKVDSRLDSQLDTAFTAIIEPYRAAVDSVMAIPVGRALTDFKRGEAPLLNLVSDIVASVGQRLAGRKPDLAIMNKGGLRTDLAKGDITKGDIMQVMPFDNRVVVMEISGADLLDAFNVMASRGGDGVSIGVRAVIDPATGMCSSVTIGGKKIDPKRTYLLTTIDYLANGGDYMAPLRRGKIVAESDNVLYDDVISEFSRGNLRRGARADNTKRMNTQTK